MMQRIAVDIGGTFTDLVALDDAAGAVVLEKALTTPRNFADGVIQTIIRSGADPQDVRHFVHGTTVVINALTERKGARVALITTRGFRDVLEIQRANRPDMYNLFYRKPKPFVPRRFRFEVRERLSYEGGVLEPLAEEDVLAAIEECRRAGVEAIAVCYIHAYANPTHERRTKEIIREIWPEVPVTLSHELTQEWREYERTNTTVLNAYVQPAATLYLSTLDQRLSDMAMPARRYVMQSNGGTATFAEAQRVSIHLVESGPVGGVIGAALVAHAVGEGSAIAFDMGGTTAKVSLIDQGQLKTTTDYHLEKTAAWAGYPLKIPVVDIVEVGAGGGSIAWVDEGGALSVGPRSAGADPGPACYGLGGIEPTVTDANLLTGRLNPEYFLGGRMRLDLARAEASIRRISDRFQLSPTEGALGILRLANANMRAALERVSIERGHDPRDFALVAYGGAGGLHGATLAQELRMKKVIVPRAPGQFSAWGMLMTDVRHDFIRTRVMPCNDDQVDEIIRVFGGLETEAYGRFEVEGFSADRVKIERFLDLRYEGQEHTVRTPVSEDVLVPRWLKVIAAKFHELHKQAYSFRLDDPLEIVNFHVVGWAEVDKPALEPVKSEGRSLEQAIKGERSILFEDAGLVRAVTYERDLLPIGRGVRGPAVVEEPACTTVVCPGQEVTVDHYGNLVIREVEG